MSGAIDAKALGDLMDGDAGGLAEVIVQLEHDLAQKDDMYRRLLDQCRYQHLVMAEIHGLSHAETFTHGQDIKDIHRKAQAALSAVSKSGLLE